jgi:hypothetical protein
MMEEMQNLAQSGKITDRQAALFSSSEKPVEELYDVNADPYQMHNLAERPECQAVLKQMRTECSEWMKRTGDLGLLPEHEMNRRAKETTFYDLGSDPEQNPVGSLLHAAWLANEGNMDNLPRLLELLAGQDAVLRWWGAIGITRLGRKAIAAKDAVGVALKDDAPEVRIAAAEAMCALGLDEDGLVVLIAALEHESIFVRMRSMNVLLDLGERARAALPHVAKARMERKSAEIDPYHLDHAIDMFARKLGTTCDALPGS